MARRRVSAFAAALLAVGAAHAADPAGGPAPAPVTPEEAPVELDKLLQLPSSLDYSAETRRGESRGEWRARFRRLREALDQERVALREAGVEWVVFAGFMRVVTPVLLEPFHRRVVNVHPALLPAFPGVNAQRQALEAGVKITGCTVHLVDAGVDTGPILAQAAVPVLPTDDLETLRLRILEKEHELLPEVVRALAEGRLKEDDLGRPYLARFESARLG